MVPPNGQFGDTILHNYNDVLRVKRELCWNDVQLCFNDILLRQVLKSFLEISQIFSAWKLLTKLRSLTVRIVVTTLFFNRRKWVTPTWITWSSFNLQVHRRNGESFGLRLFRYIWLKKLLCCQVNRLLSCVCIDIYEHWLLLTRTFLDTLLVKNKYLLLLASFWLLFGHTRQRSGLLSENLGGFHLWGLYVLSQIYLAWLWWLGIIHLCRLLINGWNIPRLK